MNILLIISVLKKSTSKLILVRESVVYNHRISLFSIKFKLIKNITFPAYYKKFTSFSLKNQSKLSDQVEFIQAKILKAL